MLKTAHFLTYVNVVDLYQPRGLGLVSQLYSSNE